MHLETGNDILHPERGSGRGDEPTFGGHTENPNTEAYIITTDVICGVLEIPYSMMMQRPQNQDKECLDQLKADKQFTLCCTEMVEFGGPKVWGFI